MWGAANQEEQSRVGRAGKSGSNSLVQVDLSVILRCTDAHGRVEGNWIGGGRLEERTNPKERDMVVVQQHKAPAPTIYHGRVDEVDTEGCYLVCEGASRATVWHMHWRDDVPPWP